jgi:predicted dehydrogenase
MKKASSRRSFLQKMGGTAAAMAIGSSLTAKDQPVVRLQSEVRVASNDRVQIGLIGAGIIGHYDTDTALQVPGVELVAACDLYQGRLDFAREKWGNSLFVTRDYREVLARPDVDAVLICVPDHWHAQIAIDAMLAGKHVYCEKPMVQRLEDGPKVIATQQKTGKVMQIGSQRASSVALIEARKHLQSGIIGKLSFVEGAIDRWDANGAWNYSIPTDATPENCDWECFQGYAKKQPFDPVRFFRWRNYSDYGTGVAGDLFVHLITGLHAMTGALGPNKVFSLGDLNYWKDGRDAFDLMTGVLDYPKTDRHEAFQVFLRANLADGGGGGGATRLVGTEGVIEMGWNDFVVKHFKRPEAQGYGGYDSYESFSAKQKAEYKKWYDAKFGGKSTEWKVGEPIKFAAADNYDDRYDHLVNFFNSVRTGAPNVEDPAFGFRAAAPCLLSLMSARQRKALRWDPVAMRQVK